MGARYGRFHVLIVDGNSVPLIRLSVAPRVLWSSVALLALVASATGITLVEYARLKGQHHETSARLRALDGELARLALADHRLAEIQAEVARWPDIHANIWRPLGQTPGRPDDAGTGLERLLAAIRGEGRMLRTLEGFMARSGRLLAALPSGWPLRAAINSGFGRRRSPWTGGLEFHRGVDLAADVGTPVRATAPGVVAFAGRAPDYGNFVVLDHGEDVKTRFGHLQKIQITPGQRVERGQQIAVSGNTGQTTGPHLHYEILVHGRPIDPRMSLSD